MKKTGAIMKNNVIPLRRDVLPVNIFQMIEDYMHGKLQTIHIIGATADGRVVSTSAGDIPAIIAKHDTLKKSR